MRKRESRWLRQFRRKEKRASKNWVAYTIRNVALREMGFASYAEYLESDLWEGIRSRRLAEHPKCSCCEKDATCVHHDTYYKKLLMGDEKSVRCDLYPLCNGCHRRVEFDWDRKRSSGEAIREFRRMLYKFRNGRSKGQMIREKLAGRKHVRRPSLPEREILALDNTDMRYA